MSAALTFYPRVFALVVAALLGYALILIFAPFFTAMCWAAFLAFLLFPSNVRLRRRLRGNGPRRRPADGAGADHHPAAALARCRSSSWRRFPCCFRSCRKPRAQWDIKSFSDLQRFPWIARANAWLQAHTGISATQVQSWLVSGIASRSCSARPA